MNAVGIDVSKGKSMVAIIRPFGEIVSAPFEIKHTASDINSLVELINSVEGESRIVMEHTGRYYEVLAHQLSEANLFVSAINPKLIKDFDNDSLRKVKSDKSDSVKIARYALDKWHNLKQYSVMNELRNQLKTMNRQFSFYMNDLTKLIIKQAVDQLNSASTTVESLRTLMHETASKLPEYPIVMDMKGVGPSLGPQLMAEIGDVSRFTHKGAITAFAGVDPGVNESGTYEQKSVPTSKRGSSNLRKTLFQVMDALIKT